MHAATVQPAVTVGVLTTLVLAACGPAPTPPLTAPTPVPTIPLAEATPLGITDLAALEAHLAASGIQLTAEGEQDVGYLDTPAHIYRLANGESLEVHVYPDPATAHEVSRRVSPDGRVIRDAAGQPVRIEWLGKVYLFRSGPLIVIYVGQSPPTLGALLRGLGPPFAGG